MGRSKSPRLPRELIDRMRRKMTVIMKMRNRALTVGRKANKKYVVMTTKANKEVVRFCESPQPDPHQICVSFMFKHKSKKYFLYCKEKKDNPCLELKPEESYVTSEKANLFKVTIDSERYKFQPYLNDGWFLCVSKKVLKLDNDCDSENTLFVLEKRGRCTFTTGEVFLSNEGNHTSRRVSRQQRK
ncbi:uncharacterized protein LOC144510069 isoform X2 [Mustelus asterias]